MTFLGLHTFKIKGKIETKNKFIWGLAFCYPINTKWGDYHSNIRKMDNKNLIFTLCESIWVWIFFVFLHFYIPILYLEGCAYNFIWYVCLHIYTDSHTKTKWFPETTSSSKREMTWAYVYLKYSTVTEKCLLRTTQECIWLSLAVYAGITNDHLLMNILN